MDGKQRVGHQVRPVLKARHPLLVTMRLAKGLPTLRGLAELDVVREVLREMLVREGVRFVEYSVMSNHLHFLVEADGRACLTSAMTSFAVRLARRLNKLWGRSGRVFSDRFHELVLTCPRAVHWALRFVLKNGRKHGVRLERALFDLYSSEVWFEHFEEELDMDWVGKLHIERRKAETILGKSPCARPKTWLLLGGWRKFAPLSVFSAPASGLPRECAMNGVFG